MDGPVRLYARKEHAVPGIPLTPFLYPFWGFPTWSDRTPFMQATYERHPVDTRHFKLVMDVKDAEYYLIPHDYWHLKDRAPKALAKMLAEGRAAGIPFLIDASGDAAGVVDVPDAKVLRINQYRFALPQNEITVPVPCEDLLESYGGGKVMLRQKGEKAIVGFVGWARLPLRTRLRSFLRELPHRIGSVFDSDLKAYRKGVFWRERAVRIFGSSGAVSSNFIVRSSYSGHTATMEKDPLTLRREFVFNILNSDYTLIVRGDANTATRFYETLSLGRIPVVIDTACVFPLEDRIDYREFCLFIDMRDLPRAPEILAEFHKNLTPLRFIAMQEKARYVFEHYLRYDAFSEHLAGVLRGRDNGVT